MEDGRRLPARRALQLGEDRDQGSEIRGQVTVSGPDIGCHFGRGNSKVSTTIRYSEAFKKQVVDEIARGKFSSAYKA